MHAVLMPVGADLYAVPVSWVSEVVAAPRPVWLPTAPPTVLGLFNLRGEIVPLYDTAALLGTGPMSTVAFTVVVRTPLGLAGLAATGLPSRARLDAPLGPSELHGTAGAHRLDERVAVVL